MTLCSSVLREAAQPFRGTQASALRPPLPAFGLTVLTVPSASGVRPPCFPPSGYLTESPHVLRRELASPLVQGRASERREGAQGPSLLPGGTMAGFGGGAGMLPPVESCAHDPPTPLPQLSLPSAPTLPGTWAEPQCLSQAPPS